MSTKEQIQLAKLFWHHVKNADLEKAVSFLMVKGLPKEDILKVSRLARNNSPQWEADLIRWESHENN